MTAHAHTHKGALAVSVPFEAGEISILARDTGPETRKDSVALR